MIGLHDDAGAAPPVSHAPALAAKTFAVQGWLQAGLGLEHRPQQEQMARAVAAAMEGDEVLLFEAGTGVGKSLAYLVPGIIQALDQSRQMIVSTHTISLQEQIETQDLPLCRRLFESVGALKPYAKFKSAVLVGKANYLCTTRLAHALQGRQELFPTAEQAELQRLAAWAKTSREGLRHELNPAPAPEVWEVVNADSSACSHKNCAGGGCFYQRARARLRQAQVIIVNHSLLFTHLNAGGASEKGGTRGVLFPDDFVVLDEAQTVPEVATEHFGLRLSSYGTDRLLKYLWHPQKKRGLLHRLGGAREKQLVEEALEAAEQFFGFLRDSLLARQPVVRLREEGFAEPWLDAPLLALGKAVGALADRLDDGRDRDELLEQRGRLTTYRTGIRQFLGLNAEDHVHWLERSGRKGQIVTLRTAPVDVAPYLREHLLRRKTAVVFTSATLAMGGQIEPYQQRVGAEEARAVVVASPFDYERNLRVYVAADMPLPSPADARLAVDALIDYLEFCTLQVAGGSLVLFTSYHDLRRCADALEPVYARHRRPFFMQGAEASRTELARRMRSAGNAILFGTDSFWTGVDVPGDALSQVVITRLPFDVPTHPVAEARAEWIRERGGNPFNELTLPEALVKFRQGIGRLIRTQTDRGLVTILDARVLAKAYGRLFLECLPKREYQRLTRENRAARFKPFVCSDPR
ncbi:MAG: helicase C-terminal domain-containing protein [Opitutaceae bacterium]|nr:helicase C-terminal domain-containing protein [Opitutaceae bacterium]